MIADPFPHIVATDWFSTELLEACLGEFPAPESPGWRKFKNSREHKYEGPEAMWGDATQHYFEELAHLGQKFTVEFDLPDLTLETIGGGYHLISPGGFLNVHTDFSISTKTKRYRRVNVLTYLNRDWQDADGGLLELWDDDGPAVTIAPEFGTTVAFVTSASSWHGHPTPTARWRASLAGYFFTEDPPDGFVDQPTTWHQNDRFKAAWS